MSVSVEKTGKTVTEAVDAALAELGMSIDEVVVEVLEEGVASKDGAPYRPARVLVTAEDDKQRYYGDSVNQADHEDEETVAAIKSFVEQVTSAFALPCSVNITLNEDSIDVNIDGDNCGIIIGRGGETLSALQYLTSLVANRERENQVHVHLDVAGYRRRHESNLAAMARRAAAKVARYGRTFEMNPMTPADRRVIHFSLQNFRGVETYSEGEGAERRVIIAPVRKNND